MAELNHQKWVLDTQELQDVKVSFPLAVDDRADVSKKVVVTKTIRCKGDTFDLLT